MALEHTINQESFGNLNESVQEHYSKDGDNYHLQATGLVPKSRLDEFRENNISLSAANEKHETDIADLNKQLEAASKDGDVDALVESKIKKRIETLNSEHETKVNELTEGKSSAESQLSKLLVGDAVSREAIAAGVQDTALEDVLTRANKVFKVVKGIATPYDGDEVIYGKDGVTPLTVKDWLAGQAATAPHLFKKSEGSGASNDNQGGGATKQTLSSTQKIAAGLRANS